MDWPINTKSVNNKISIADTKRRNMTERLENMLEWDEPLSRTVFHELNSSKNFELYKGLIRVDTKNKLYDLLHLAIKHLGVNANYNWIDTSLITDMSHMGFGTYFNGHIELWDVSNVTDMSYMFCNAASFNRNIGNWDVSKVTDME
jgi:surface protein